MNRHIEKKIYLRISYFEQIKENQLNGKNYTLNL